MTTLPADLSHPCYHDDDAARIMFEAIRWPQGPFCPFCGALDHVSPFGGKSMGPGWYWCSVCRDKFTVRVATVLHRSHIPLHKWLIGFRLYASSKKGFSAHQLHRMLGIHYRSAWFMAMRIREAMKDDGAPLGGEGKVIEADETYFGQAGSHAPDSWIFVNGVGWVRKGGAEKMKIMTLVERGGSARSVRSIASPRRRFMKSLLRMPSSKARSTPTKRATTRVRVAALPSTKQSCIPLKSMSVGKHTLTPLKVITQSSSEE
jgi:transposase-like protein